MMKIPNNQLMPFVKNMMQSNNKWLIFFPKIEMKMLKIVPNFKERTDDQLESTTLELNFTSGNPRLEHLVKAMYQCDILPF